MKTYYKDVISDRIKKNISKSNGDFVLKGLSINKLSLKQLISLSYLLFELEIAKDVSK